ncbi:MAG TPA: winged helix-turn-helix domain-containing protein [Fimbriimonadaceae bacterium]|nr:winged helix-turn-helix domain-containing protein [Fimbriimonadaceae bacterium]
MHIHTLRDLAQVKAMADPIRMRILHELAREPMTAMQLARVLNEKTTKIYHHVEALEHAGLIVLAETRQNRGFVEKRYRAIADDFVVDSGLLAVTEGPGKFTGEYEQLFLSALEASLLEARRSIAAGAMQAGKRLIYRLSLAGGEEEIQAVVGRISELAESLRPEAGSPAYALTIALHPVAPAGSDAAVRPGEISEAAR